MHFDVLRTSCSDRPTLANSHAQATATVKSFVSASSNVKPVIILSYEMFRKYSPHLCQLSNGFLVCDEGANNPHAVEFVIKTSDTNTEMGLLLL